jgi:hypothetical protein
VFLGIGTKKRRAFLSDRSSLSCEHKACGRGRDGRAYKAGWGFIRGLLVTCRSYQKGCLNSICGAATFSTNQWLKRPLSVRPACGTALAVQQETSVRKRQERTNQGAHRAPGVAIMSHPALLGTFSGAAGHGPPARRHDRRIEQRWYRRSRLGLGHHEQHRKRRPIRIHHRWIASSRHQRQRPDRCQQRGHLGWHHQQRGFAESEPTSHDLVTGVREQPNGDWQHRRDPLVHLKRQRQHFCSFL